jgi:hypothetical protein
MRHAILYLLLTFGLCAVSCHARAAGDDATFLMQAHAKYDAPFERNLQSFSCAVEFNWKQHFTEVVRLGDEGTDDEIAKFIQPIRNRVTVTSQNASVSAGMNQDEISKLPHGGMAERSAFVKNGVTEMVRRLISYLGVGDLVGRFSGGSSRCRFIPLALILARQPFTL